MAGDLLVFRSVADLQAGAASLIAGAIREVLFVQSRCSIALAGGTTPGAIYARLADEDAVGEIPWYRVELLFGDERFVPPDHEDSNYRMAKEAFGPVFDQCAAVHRMPGELADRAKAAATAEAPFAEPVDIMLLGMGPDAHVASLFPGSVAFAHRGALAMAIEGPKPPPWRITVTPRVIEAARRTFVFVTGAAKSQAVQDVFTRPFDPNTRPAQLALGGTWFLDAEAAARLPSVGGLWR